MAGRKEGVIYNNENWLLKYPDNMKEKDLKGIDVSYGNNPIAEYIGSHVYQLLGIPVHETLLGTRNGKCVVGCKDFVGDLEKLTEFREFKVSYVPHFINAEGDITNGTGMDIEEAKLCLKEHPYLSNVPEVEDRFWTMFVVDTLNGNPDRNNGNWGCVQDLQTREYRLAPVYDNGNCLYFRLSNEKMKEALKDHNRMLQLAISNTQSRFTKDGHIVNPFKYLKDNRVKQLEVIRNLNIDDVCKIILEATDNTVMVEFYKELYTLRLQELRCILETQYTNELDVF
ncbi:CtkA family protein [Acetivibrio ethanolgignens]|uniref:HipA-like C-terminal domain-containing protein n=1 Tax=Acetivibrio ethanolgignens TaxID=290052 RepID=A0A0V8QET2_9FIRM|nr:CtkA family protein [Acetivibrio ethanolgignens]KSV58742.1 hypothetical protein ASU35_11810 [Acetivibrio ethanolgignens]